MAKSELVDCYHFVQRNDNPDALGSYDLILCLAKGGSRHTLSAFLPATTISGSTSSVD
jgi:hypothetical protein